ncbi:MAG: HD domain-containing protein [Lachnospiraceae bacterium]|nr:HD domain-containing protein [Lachnospiraceae bacterium]
MSFQKDDRINQIWNHPVYQEQYRILQEVEKTRVFCGHSLEHFLSVARLMWIYNLEQKAGLDKEQVYAAALLHDIGRGMQYKEGIPHEKAGIELAERILPDCGFQKDEIRSIVSAIASHRGSNEAGEKNFLGELLYRADKACRNCMICSAEPECNWPEEKKNRVLRD